MRYLAEFYLPEPDADLAGLVRRGQAGAAEVSRRGFTVSCVRAIHLADDESCFVVYEADSADAVTAAGRAAGLAFDRVAAIRTSDAGLAAGFAGSVNRAGRAP